MQDKNIKENDIKTLLNIMDELRDVDSGCPWDLQQTFETIAPYTIEEAYEVADAVQQNDMDGLRGELGDLLFQIVFHSKLAEEQQSFNFKDVVASICKKLIHRHPHVFAGENIAESDLTARWEASKKDERANTDSDGILSDINYHQPAMNQAYKLQKKASSVGFDWQCIESVIEKLDEEIAELKEEISLDNNQQRIEEELGDVLFSCINLSRHLNIDPEWSLRKANERFINRFNYIEKKLKKSGVSIEDSSTDILNSLWDEAKHNEN